MNRRPAKNSYSSRTSGRCAPSAVSPPPEPLLAQFTGWKAPFQRERQPGKNGTFFIKRPLHVPVQFARSNNDLYRVSTVVSPILSSDSRRLHASLWLSTFGAGTSPAENTEITLTNTADISSQVLNVFQLFSDGPAVPGALALWIRPATETVPGTQQIRRNFCRSILNVVLSRTQTVRTRKPF